MVTTRLYVLLFSAVVAVAVSSQQAGSALRVRGTIEAYEPSSRTLSVSTANGTVEFPLASNTRIRQGGRAIDAAALAKLTGYRADIHYSESGGRKTVESVHVTGKPKGAD